jgi:hypothetical protein
MDPVPTPSIAALIELAVLALGGPTVVVGLEEIVKHYVLSSPNIVRTTPPGTLVDGDVVAGPHIPVTFSLVFAACAIDFEIAAQLSKTAISGAERFAQWQHTVQFTLIFAALTFVVLQAAIFHVILKCEWRRRDPLIDHGRQLALGDLSGRWWTLRLVLLTIGFLISLVAMALPIAIIFMPLDVANRLLL